MTGRKRRWRVARLVMLLAVIIAFRPVSAKAGEPGQDLSLVVCEEQDFSTLSCLDFGQQYVEGEGLYVYTKTYDSIPYVLIQKANYHGTDTEDYFGNYFSPKIENKYGSDLMGEIEYGDFQTGGKELAAVRYIYRLGQYVVHMIHLVDVREDADVYYTVKFLQDQEEDSLAALDSIVANYQPDADAYTWKGDGPAPQTEMSETEDTDGHLGGDGTGRQPETDGRTGNDDLPGGVTASGNIGFLGLGKKEEEPQTGPVSGTTIPSVAGRTKEEPQNETGTLQNETEEPQTERSSGTSYDDSNTARDPQPKSTDVEQLGDHAVSKVDPVIRRTEYYEDERFSMYIPEGWVVQTTGMYSSLVIRVYDPQVPDRSLFLFCGIYPFIKSAEAKAWYEANQGVLDGAFELFKDAPVLGDLSVLSFLTALEDLREFCSKYYDSGLTWNPDIIPEFGSCRIAEQWESNIISFDECAAKTVAHFFYDSPMSGANCSALVTAQPTAGETFYADGLDLGFNSVYAFTGLTAPTKEITQMLGTMLRCLSSLCFSEEFLSQALACDEMRPEILTMMPDILICVEDQFNRKWDTRDITPEVEANMQSDEEQGLIRLIDTENERDIYLADQAFYEVYSANRASYEKQELYPISEVDDIYYTWQVKYRVES